MIRILIVSYYWPPFNSIASHRAYSWANCWRDKDCDITVLTVKRSQISSLDHRLMPIQGVLIKAIGDHGLLSFFERLLRFTHLRNVAKYLYKNINPARSPLSIDWSAGWLKNSLPWLRNIAGSIDVVVSTYGPPTCHLIAHELKVLNPRILWVADYRDPWNFPSFSAGSKRSNGNIEKLELSTVGRNADMITSVSDYLVHYISNKLSKDGYKISNGYHRSDWRIPLDSSSRVSKKTGSLNLVYTGTLYPECWQLGDPSPLLAAIRSLEISCFIEPGQIQFKLYGPNSDSIKYLPIYKSCAHFIDICGLVTRPESLCAQQNADLLILLSSAASSARGIITGKIYEYITSGVPIICIGARPGDEISVILSGARVGLSFEASQVQSISNLLLECFNSNNLPSWYMPNISYIQRFDRHKIASSFYELISDYYAKKRPSKSEPTSCL